MKQSVSTSLRALVPIVILICGCSKTLIHSNLSSLADGSKGCSIFTTDHEISPYYGDSLIYMRSNDPSGYLISPVNKNGQGTYVSWPAGLSIDPQSGVIDLSKTEPGARYNVGFVNATTHDTAYNQVIIAGAGYLDGIYDMNSGDTLLQPFFNAIPVLTHSCVNGNKCNFDGNQFFSGQRLEQGPAVEPGSGVIDLKRSLSQGLFGSNPQNGDTQRITVYYRINDNSNGSLQKTAVIVHYYHSFSDVPESLIARTLGARADFMGRQVVGTKIADASTTPVVTAGSTPPLGGSGTAASGGSPPQPIVVSNRPPHVVIVNAGH